MKQIDVIREAKELYVNGVYNAMCYCFMHVLLPSGYNWAWYMSENVPLFCHQIAVERFGAYKIEDGFWWDEGDRKSRLKYLIG